MVPCYIISNISNNEILYIPYDTCNESQSVTEFGHAQSGIIRLLYNQTIEIEKSRIKQERIDEIKKSGLIRIGETNKQPRPAVINNALSSKPIVLPGQVFGPAGTGVRYFPSNNIIILDDYSESILGLELLEQPIGASVEIIGKRFSFLASENGTYEFNVRPFKNVNGFIIYGDYELVQVTVTLTPIISLNGDDYPTVHPGEGGSCWTYVFQPFLLVEVNEIPAGHYLDIGYYDGPTWINLINDLTVLAVFEVPTVEATGYNIQARYKLIVTDEYVGVASNTLTVLAPYPPIDAVVVAQSDGAAVHDTIIHWSNTGIEAHVEFETSTYTDSVNNVSNPYYRVNLGGVPGTTAPYSGWAWYSQAGVPGFKTELTGSYIELLIPSLTLDGNDWPITHPGESGSCWSGDGINSILLNLTATSIDINHTINLYTDVNAGGWNGAGTALGGPVSIDLVVGNPPLATVDVGIELVSNIDGNPLVGTNLQVSTIMPLETPDIATPGSYANTDNAGTVELFVQGSYLFGTPSDPPCRILINFHDDTHLTTSPWDQYIYPNNLEMGMTWTDMDLSYSTDPQDGDPFTLRCHTLDFDNGTYPPSIKAVLNSTYGVI